MAEQLSTNDATTPIIYNISAPVGPGQTNNPDDVLLVQFLIAQGLPASTAVRVKTPPPPINGTFDLVTGFWIYEIEFALKSHNPHQVVDGVVSPVRGPGIDYVANTPWVIAALNAKFKQLFPDQFDNLSNDPRLSPSLRAALSD